MEFSGLRTIFVFLSTKAMGKGKIVLIDDDPTSNFLSKFVLSQIDENIHVRIFADCHEILEQLHSIDFMSNDLLLLDINLGLCSGWDVLEIIESRNQLNKACIPQIVMLSSSINSEDRSKAESYKSVSGFISKPLNEEAIRPFLSTLNSA